MSKISLVTPLLDKISYPNDLKQLPREQLPQLCDELRQFVIESVAQTGGHLASSLGVIELTVAIHYVFDMPNDGLIWDVGHQSYPHKILTGRKDKMPTLRQKGGLSGFPKRSESDYDDFGTGHSSTSISAALGMAIANQYLVPADKQRQIVAVIGDGAMTAGMAFEALHHAASLSANILVVLNDNDMSISPNVGSFSSYISKVLSSELFTDIRSQGKKILKHLPPFDGLAKFAESRVKELVAHSNLFEDLGFSYQGPVDGHDVLQLVDALYMQKTKQGPRLLHIKTIKGKGYSQAEIEPIKYHGVKSFDSHAGLKSSPEKLTYTKVFSEWLLAAANREAKLMAITPAMREGSGLVEFSEQFPARYFDVAIAEQHAVTLAAGMACKGVKPVVAIYSTFLQRAYDQLVHDVAIQNLDVLFAIDRAGIVGEDGSTHAGVFDIAFMRTVPNLVIMTPSDENEMVLMLNTGLFYQGPAAVRYPKGTGMGNSLAVNVDTLPIGKAIVRQQGSGVAVLVFGTLLAAIQEATQQVGATLVDMRFVKPLDIACLDELLLTHQRFMVIEEGAIKGGIGEEVANYLYQKQANIQVQCHGVADDFIQQGSRDEVLAFCGLDKSTLTTKLIEFAKN